MVTSRLSAAVVDGSSGEKSACFEVVPTRSYDRVLPRVPLPGAQAGCGLGVVLRVSVADGVPDRLGVTAAVREGVGDGPTHMSELVLDGFAPTANPLGHAARHTPLRNGYAAACADVSDASS
jgi:hypothetical protein